MNRSDQSSLDTIDNEYSNKINFLLENNYNYNNNSLSIGKNSFHIKNHSAIFLKGKNKYKNKKTNSSYYNSNYISNYNSKYDKNFSSLFNRKYNIHYNIKKNKKVILKPKKEFRIDKENFAKDYINKKIYLDKYCNEEIKFHRGLLQSKTCEIECTREPIEFDLKKSKRDADLTFNKIFEICKSQTNKKNISNYIKQRNIMSGIGVKNTAISTNGDKKIVYSLYEIFKGGKNEENKIIDDKEKKKILFNNEEKMKELNLEYEQMVKKEGEIKEKKIKLLEEITMKK